MGRRKISLEDERTSARKDARAETLLEHALGAMRDAMQALHDAGRDREGFDIERALRIMPGTTP